MISLRDLLGLGLALALTAMGCGRRMAVEPTILELPSPSDATAQALTKYDRNGDRSLSHEELAACPGLLSAVKTIDADGNNAISSDELQNRIAQIVDRNVRFLVLPCRLEIDGKPTGAAEVRFEPESFFGAMNKPAVATTGADGRAFPKTEGEPVPGIYPGYYRVRVSRKDAAGRETLPAKFNTDSQVGVEIGIKDTPYYEDAELVLRLSMK